MIWTAELASAAAGAHAENEDFAAVSAVGAVLLDGAGMPDDMESGCSHGTPWYARQLGITLLSAISAEDGRSLQRSLADSITHVRLMHVRVCDLSGGGSPSATVVAVRVRNDHLEYLVLSDSVLLIRATAAEPLVIKDDRMERLCRPHMAWMNRLPIGTPEHTAALREFIGTVRAQRNIDDGFWVATDDPAAACHSLTGSVPLTEVQTVQLLSDGACRLTDPFGLLTWAELADVIRTEGPADAVRRTRSAEASDPRGLRWPRGKVTDDATIVSITCPPPGPPGRRGTALA
jgi:hypothetical protein